MEMRGFVIWNGALLKYPENVPGTKNIFKIPNTVEIIASDIGDFSFFEYSVEIPSSVEIVCGSIFDGFVSHTKIDVTVNWSGRTKPRRLV